MIARSLSAALGVLVPFAVSIPSGVAKLDPAKLNKYENNHINYVEFKANDLERITR